jgi:pimeloyl-ACP methyl ester carboxylesterase
VRARALAGDMPSRTRVKQFQINISNEQITTLQARLSQTIWPNEIKNEKWQYGTNLSFMQRMCRHWAEKFDWRLWEAKLNAYPQFLAQIDGLTVHFLHVRAREPKSFPILLTHGWPSSVFEYLQLIPLLEDFDLVIPSLPGHGFSSPATKGGLSIFRTAEVWHQLMTQTLGYSKYIAQGGDWGAYLASRLGYLFPESLAGIHLSYVTGGLVPYLDADSVPLTEKEKAMVEQRKQWDRLEGGYEHLHSTKPQTIAFALSDSPVGLAAWILEKWRSWTDCQGDPERKFGRDYLLANVSWYWFTNSSASAARLYYETRMNPWILGRGDKISVPTAIASFPRELVVSPKEWAERFYNVVQWTDMSGGGHFAAAEEPQLLAADLRKFVGTLKN